MLKKDLPLDYFFLPQSQETLLLYFNITNSGSKQFKQLSIQSYAHHRLLKVQNGGQRVSAARMDKLRSTWDRH